MTGPLAIECPRCGSNPGDPCINLSKSGVGRSAFQYSKKTPHAERVSAALNERQTMTNAEKQARQEGVDAALEAAETWAADAVKTGGDPVGAIKGLRAATGIRRGTDNPGKGVRGGDYTTDADGSNPRNVYTGEPLEL